MITPPTPRSSPAQIPELIALICSFLDSPGLALTSQLNQTWSQISLPLLYRDISLTRLAFNLDSLEYGLLKNGHLCQRLTAARDVNHWCSRIVQALLHMPNLVELSATWMSTELLEAIVQLPHLRHLSIPRLQGYQPEESDYFSPTFRGSAKITHLNMADTNMMTDETLFQITRTCPQIQVLTVSGNRCLTSDGLVRWCQGLADEEQEQNDQQGRERLLLNPKDQSLALPLTPITLTTALTTINFSNCNRIGPEGYEALFQRSRHLAHVNLMSTRVDDQGLSVLVKRNRHLQSLVLNCCAAISDSGLQQLLRTCRELVSISFLYCHRITVKVFFQALWACLGLKELRFSLNNQHSHLIQNGLREDQEDSTQEQTQQGQVLDQEQAQDLPNTHFYEPKLQFMIAGPELKEKMAPFQDPSTTSSTLQQYRQHLMVAQMCRQIERLRQLQVLDMRDTFLPWNVSSGLCRLSGLNRLLCLEWTGLEAAMGVQEVNWLAGEWTPPLQVAESGSESESEDGSSHSLRSRMPLPLLTKLVFKGGYSMPGDLQKALHLRRPALELQFIQVKDSSS